MKLKPVALLVIGLFLGSTIALMVIKSGILNRLAD
jgi:hypothetical protein